MISVTKNAGAGRSRHNLRPSWIEVERAALQNNVRTIKNRVGRDVALFTTLKSNACGFDLEQAGPLLDAEDAVHGISLVDMGDAVRLRECGVTKPILLFGGNFLDGEALWIAYEHRFILTAHDAHSLAAITGSEHALEFVVEFNVGAERLGFLPEHARDTISEIGRSRRAKLAGVTAHMHLTAGDGALQAAREQYDRFRGVLEAFTAAEAGLRYMLIASSSTLLVTNDMNLTAVDPGHLVFGMVPASAPLGRDLRCALRAIKSRLIQVGEIGYGDGRNAPFTSRSGMRTGIFPFGASDGIARINCGYVLVGGKKAPILTINAEHTEIDVSAIPSAQVGEEVVIVGSQAGAQITIADVEAKYPAMHSSADTVRNISPFIPRVYVD